MPRVSADKGKPPARLEAYAPFGNPDGSKTDFTEIERDFYDFGEDRAFGDLAMRASDARVRVIVGKLGAGKTVYLRRLQDFQTSQSSTYSCQVQMDLLETDVVVRASQLFPEWTLTEKWIRLWQRAILRGLVSYLTCDQTLRQYVGDEQLRALTSEYEHLFRPFKTPMSVASQLSEIIMGSHTRSDLNNYLEHFQWAELEHVVSGIVSACPPIFFYLDASDEEFAHAPLYWMRCQKGLFYAVMRLFRDPRFATNVHVVVTVREVVLTSVLHSEHAPRYRSSPNIRSLAWSSEALRTLLQVKLDRLPKQYFIAGFRDGRSVTSWLGIDKLENVERGVFEDVAEYIVRHCRAVPRDIILMGNALCQEVLRQRRAGAEAVPSEAVRRIVSETAQIFGASQLAQSANQIAADLMPAQASTHGYDNYYTSSLEYRDQIRSQLDELLLAVGTDRFSYEDLLALEGEARRMWQGSTSLGAVLWQNFLLGYVGSDGRHSFYTEFQDLHFAPPRAREYLLHPCLIDTIGIRNVGSEPVCWS